MSDRLKLELKLLDKSFTIACSANQVKDFESSSNYLSNQLEQITSKTKTLNFEKALTMIALNITHELLQLRREKKSSADEMAQLVEKFETILESLENGLDENLFSKEE